MYIAINAEITGFNLSGEDAQNAIQLAKVSLERNKSLVRAELDKFMLPNGNFDGTKMQAEWFPEIEADVFLSHSHDDLELTLFIASILEDFGLKVFIDSAVWGHANDLLRKIDNELCSNGNGSYNYDSRNYSTSHVHMMLSVALNKMINKAECLFFLNTPNSVTTNSIIENKTESPWIYSEIATAKIVKRFLPKRRQLRTFSKGGEFVALTEAKIEHALDLSSFVKFINADLIDWFQDLQTNFKNEQNEHPLDSLYKYLIKRDGKLL